MVLKVRIPKTPFVSLCLLPVALAACAELPISPPARQAPPPPATAPLPPEPARPTAPVTTPLPSATMPAPMRPVPVAQPAPVAAPGNAYPAPSAVSPASGYPAAPNAPVGSAQQAPAYGIPAMPPMRGAPQLALLLPLSGNFASSGQAVRDGFLSAAADDRMHPRVRVYDIGATPDRLRMAYQNALADGATLIAGPLRKEDVAMLASWAPPVPVLGLNYLDAGARLSYGFYQFGLAPEDEARAAAADASARGLRRALALVPDTDWGPRTLAAFDSALRAKGGAVVRVERYTQGVNDQSKLIASLMGVTASEERHAALTNVLGAKSEFESRRRGDIDMIFIGARAQDARLLIPQLRFNRGGDLPVYSTALIYDGKPAADLNGVRFCDAPWIIGQDNYWALQRSVAGPLAATSPRLFAMGRDAYTLAAGLVQGRLRVGDGVDGATGRLEWGGSTLITRTLDCAQLTADGVRAVGP